MAIFQMSDVLAVMAQEDVLVKIGGVEFTMPAQVPFTSVHDIDVIAGAKLAIMRNATSPGGKVLQVFSIDEIEVIA